MEEPIVDKGPVNKALDRMTVIAFELVLRWIDEGHDTLDIKRGLKDMIEKLNKDQ